MKKLIVLVCVVMGCVAVASAQENPAGAALLAAASQPAATNVARPNLASVTLVPTAPVAKTSAPEPAPPAWRFGLREEDSWQLSFGYAYVRFRSTPFDVSLNGINATVAKYFSEQFAVEGEVTAAFGREVFPTEHAKYLFYGGGLRIKQPVKQLESWGHVVVGGVHVQPQTAGNSRSGFAFELGGGVDWRWKPRLALRVQGDWVRSQLFGESQNNFQIATGIVFNF